MNRVLVTGMGVVSPLGDGVDQNWMSLRGVKRRSNLSGQIASLPSVARNDSFSGFGRAKELAEKACTEALLDAGLQDVDPERIGCTVSASKPLFHGDIPQPPDGINESVARGSGLRGERRNVIAACATGAYSIALGASWIEQGLCDVVVAGSVEPYPHPLIEAGFKKMGVVSAEGITRPFDKRRSGFTFGEGAGIVVLESESHFKKRTAANRNDGQPERRPTGKSAIGNSFKEDYRSPKFRSADFQVNRLSGQPPYAVLSGWALGSDSHSAVAFNSNGARIAGVIDRALKRARIPAKAVRHVNAHGTATRLNDWIETQALFQAFGPHARDLMISATKASTGHLLGASGSVEFIFTVLALRHQFVPPTATLEQGDPDCALDYTPGAGHSADFEHAMSLSFGFGGPIGALVVSKC